MVPQIIHNRRHGGHGRIAANDFEYISLFGHPPPHLPRGVIQPGEGEIIQVMIPHELGRLARAYLESLKGEFCRGDGQKAKKTSEEAEKEYREFLASLLRYLLLSDRRIGLLNLFWLAHMKTLREIFLELFPRKQKKAEKGYSLWPIISGFFRRSRNSVFTALETPEKRKILFNLGRNYNWGLIDSLMEDQFHLTENDVRNFDAAGSLGEGNPSFSLDGESFEATVAVLEKKFQEDIEKNDMKFNRLLKRRITGFIEGSSSFSADEVSSSYLFHSGILSHYLTGGKTVEILLKNRSVKRAVKKTGSWDFFVEEFLRINDALKRSEYVQFFQESIRTIPFGRDDKEMKSLFQEGQLYKFSLHAPVVNNFRKAVILFADIRDFTRTSEGAISERDLTVRLYEVFDPLVHIITSLGGMIDKFTGDGMMITFGAIRSLTGANLKALRCAVAIQEGVTRLRQSGRTSFRLGLSLHSGRAFIADFLLNDTEKESTVIGRQVNLAARISSTQTQPAVLFGTSGNVRKKDLDSTGPSSQEAVFIDGNDSLYNVGVAASGAFLNDLKKTVDMETCTMGDRRGFRFYDGYLKSEVIFHYVGDARFKGLKEAIPVYGISWKRAGMEKDSDSHKRRKT